MEEIKQSDRGLWEDRYFHIVRKRLSGEVTLKLKTEGVILARSFNALQCEQLVYEELKGCLEMSTGGKVE